MLLKISAGWCTLLLLLLQSVYKSPLGFRSPRRPYQPQEGLMGGFRMALLLLLLLLPLGCCPLTACCFSACEAL